MATATLLLAAATVRSATASTAHSRDSSCCSATAYSSSCCSAVFVFAAATPCSRVSSRQQEARSPHTTWILAIRHPCPESAESSPVCAASHTMATTPTRTGLAPRLLLCLMTFFHQISPASCQSSGFTAVKTESSTTNSLQSSTLSPTTTDPTMSPLRSMYPTVSQYPTRFISHFPTPINSTNLLFPPSGQPSSAAPVSVPLRKPSFRPTIKPSESQPLSIASAEPTEFVIILDIFSSSSSRYPLSIYCFMGMVVLLFVSLL